MIRDTDRKPRKVRGFQVIEDECIWMKAGVVNFRLCDNAYDCQRCPFDQAMRRAMGMVRDGDSHTEAPRWVTHLKERYDGASRPCRHALTGRIEAPKICTMNYECHHCAFDQMLDDEDRTADAAAPSVGIAAGYRMADGYYYHMGHAWARFEHGGRTRIGLDDFTGKLFGRLDALVLPPLGEALAQHQVGWTFRQRDDSAAMLAPITGTVLAVNHKAMAHPDIVTTDPYGQGWLCIVEPVRPKQNLKGLYFGADSRRWIEAEGRRLMQMMGPDYEKLAATGGEAVADVRAHFPEIAWDRLVGAFLHTEIL